MKLSRAFFSVKKMQLVVSPILPAGDSSSSKSKFSFFMCVGKYSEADSSISNAKGLQSSKWSGNVNVQLPRPTPPAS